MSIYGQKKTPKSQKEDTTPYTYYNPNSRNLTIDPSIRGWGSIIRIISIDPGTVNLCIRVEERSIDKNVKYIPKPCLYEKIHMAKEDLELSEGNENKYYFKFLEIFNKYWELFKTCHVLIMERQLPFNNKALRISQHILTYFLINMRDLPQLPMIFEINSTLKTKQLGIKGLNSYGVKNWSIEYARKILISRNDQYSLDIINKKGSKKDDLADTVTQIEAFFMHIGWPINSEMISNDTYVNTNLNINSLKVNVLDHPPLKINVLNPPSLKINIINTKISNKK